jgi:hypothetical protein
VSIAGPQVRLTDARVAALAPLLERTTGALTTLWPLRRHQSLATPSAAFNERNP